MRALCHFFALNIGRAVAASELRRLGATSRAFLATDHEPMREEARKVLGDRYALQSSFHSLAIQLFPECFGKLAIFLPPVLPPCTERL